MSDYKVTVLGAGLAGCEAALWLAGKGVQVDLYEQKPMHFSPAHKSEGFAELICSNSLKAERLDSASGLLKEEMRRMGSQLLQAAEVARVAAGGALAVDRATFSAEVTRRVEECPNLTVHRQPVEHIDESAPILVATGPLTDGKLADEIGALTGDERLHFYDAVAPIVTAESLDYNKVFAASRYGRGDADYLNCPFNKAEYEAFHAALAAAERAPLHDFDTGAEQSARPDPDAHGKKADTVTVYEGCMPIEIMAARGADTMRFGPLRPVGLVDPNTGHRPWANVQLRAENKERTLYNMFPDKPEMGRAEAGVQHDTRPRERRVCPVRRHAPQHLPRRTPGAERRALPQGAPQRLLCRPDHRLRGLYGERGLRPAGSAEHLRPSRGQRAARTAHRHHVRCAHPVSHHREQALPAHGREHGHPAPAAGGPASPRQAPALHGRGRTGRGQLPAVAG